MEVKDLINYYWIQKGNDTAIHGQPLISFPGLTPELIIPLKGYFTYSYQGLVTQTDKCIFFSFIHKNVVTDFSNLEEFVVVTFKSNGIASILPFIEFNADQVIQNPVQVASLLLGEKIDKLQSLLKTQRVDQINDELDNFFYRKMNQQKLGIVSQIPTSLKTPNFSVDEIREFTNTSVSTTERFFKKETGLTPKQFLRLRRFSATLSHYFVTKEANWIAYVCKYGYYDQSHFINEFKFFTGFTPAAIYNISCLQDYRPPYNY